MSFIKKKLFFIPQKVNGWYLWRKDKKEFITCVNYEKDVAKFKIRPNDIKLDLTNIKQAQQELEKQLKLAKTISDYPKHFLQALPKSKDDDEFDPEGYNLSKIYTAITISDSLEGTPEFDVDFNTDFFSNSNYETLKNIKDEELEELEDLIDNNDVDGLYKKGWEIAEEDLEFMFPIKLEEVKE